MAKFAYNNNKNTNTGRTVFELNCNSYSYFFYKEDINLCSWSKTLVELSAKLQKLVMVFLKNFHHTEKL